MVVAMYCLAGAVLAVAAICIGKWLKEGAIGFRCRQPWCRAASLARSVGAGARKLAGRPPGSTLDVSPPQAPLRLGSGGTSPYPHGACCDQHWEYLERKLYLLQTRSRWVPNKVGGVVLELTRA